MLRPPELSPLAKPYPRHRWPLALLTSSPASQSGRGRSSSGLCSVRASVAITRRCRRVGPDALLGFPFWSFHDRHPLSLACSVQPPRRTFDKWLDGFDGLPAAGFFSLHGSRAEGRVIRFFCRGTPTVRPQGSEDPPRLTVRCPVQPRRDQRARTQQVIHTTK